MKQPVHVKIAWGLLVAALVITVAAILINQLIAYGIAAVAWLLFLCYASIAVGAEGGR